MISETAPASLVRLEDNMRGLATVLAVCAVGGCVPRAENELLDRDTQVFDSQYRQLLNNVAEFRVHPETLPRHIFLRRGTVAVEETGGVGVEEYLLSLEQARSVRWEVAPLNDPDDVARVRLLYQWVVGKLSFDRLKDKWDANEAGSGRPKVALPVGKDTPIDWFTDDKSQSQIGVFGRFGGKAVWVRDIGGAADFAVAILRAAPNSRREPGRPSAE